MNRIKATLSIITRAIPARARTRLLAISLGWILIAALEASAYTVLALSILYRQPPQWVLLSATITILITVLVTRSGYLSGVRLAGDLYAALGQSLSSARLSWFNEQRRTLISKMAGQDIPNFMSIPAHQLQTFLHAPCLPLFICIGLALLAGIKIMLLAFMLIALSFLLQLWAQSALMKADAKRDRTELDASSATMELVEHLPLLRTAAGPERALESVSTSWQQQHRLLTRINDSAARAMLIATLAGILPLAALAAYWLCTDQNNARLILASLLLMGRAGAPLSALATAGLSLNDLLNSLHHYDQLTHPPILPEPQTAATPSQHQLSLHHFTHARQAEPLNMTIPAGARLHIAGVSGSGKSTLLQLLMRFDDPIQGEIRLGNIALQQIPFTELAANIAYVAQNPFIFSGSVADNIRLGRFDASDAEIEAMARQCALGSLLDRHGAGIYQPTGQQGAALSGGERQRIAIARALLKQAPILILDEATAALDETTEQQIIHTIRQQCQTLIFVTHRTTAAWQPTHIITLAPPAETRPANPTP